MQMPDAGMDAGTGPDGGIEMCGTNRFDLRSDWPPLPESCLPRCTAETREAAAACGADNACIGMVHDADPTRDVLVDTPYRPRVASCRNPEGGLPCVVWQQFSCDAESGPYAFRAYAMPAGVTGNGSTVTPAHLWITNADGSEIIGRIDPSEADVVAPALAGGNYRLFVEHGGTAGANDFYVLKVFRQRRARPRRTTP